MHLIRRLLVACVAVSAPVVGINSLSADVRLPRIFSERMVLQRDQPIPVWGWAEPGEEVMVVLGDNTAKVTADAKGNWRVTLPKLPAGGPFSLQIVGKNNITLGNVLIGEVWLCAGQSNMEWPLDRTQHAGRDIPKADDPKLRLCRVQPIVAARPQDDCDANWAESSPGAAAKFSAVAYYLGKELRGKLDVPVGIIMCSAGGTSIETWLSAESCEQVPSLKKISRLVEQVNTDYRKLSEANLEKWITQARAAIAAGNNPPPYAPVEPIIIQRGWLPTGIYNGAINPIAGYGIRGVAWYQGEANNGDGLFYAEKLKTLINSYRQEWGQGDFPFVMVQIAPWSGYPDGNVEGIWDAQRAALTIPNTGLVMSSDAVPNLADIHPVQKEEIGQRLANWAEVNVYGKSDGIATGPLPEKIERRDDKIIIHFANAGKGLTTRDDKAPALFQLGTAAGFSDAEAKIDGNTVEVFSSQVPQPEYVRFAWHKTAQPNLVNSAGIPAMPFRTDCPVVKFNGGTQFTGKKQVEISHEPLPGTIRYTLDGSVPTADSPKYTRPIELDHTATVTARFFTDGTSSLPVSATYTKVEPTVVDGKRYSPGLDYEYYVGKWNALPEFDELTVERWGNIETLTLAASPVSTQFALRFRGFVQIPRDGKYTFVIKSDDGARLYLDGKLAIDDDGQHGAAPKPSQPLELKAGMLPIEVQYHESWGGASLSLSYEGPDLPLQEIPAAAYFRAE